MAICSPREPTTSARPAFSPALPSIMARLAHGLALEATQLEPDFVQLTEGLVQVHGTTGQIATLGTQLAEQIGGRLEQIRGGGIGALLDGSYAALQKSLAASTQRQNGLVENAQALAELQHHGRRVKGIATRLGVTRLGFSIECTRLTTHEAEFQDFVAELAQLERVVATLGAELTHQADAAKCEQTRSNEVIRRGLDELQRLSANCAKIARSAASGIESVLSTCGTLASEVATTTRGIRAHSDELIYFLQFGDIVRQRLEHVAHALASPPTEAGQLARAIAVQVAQLEAIRGEVEAAGRKLDEAFEGIGLCSGTLVRAIGGLDATTIHTGSGAAPAASLGSLQADIRHMHDLRQRAEHLGADSTRAAAAAAEVARQMGSHVARVTEANARMHMMALNAIVNTSRLGQTAAALSVLSIQVHEVAKESAVIVAAVLPLLDRVHTSAVEVAGTDPATSTRETQQATDRGLHHLGELTTWVAGMSHEARALVANQSQALTEARCHVAFLTTLHQRLCSSLAELRRASSELGPIDASAPGTAAADDLTVYTMASEREAHLRALGAAPDSTAQSSSPTGPLPSADLGDNVELF